ncbi:SusC/RagA family TonB-linked outer membrane protein [Saccharicrinis sp. FJH62]|uniref:SusC/RagA family TonB-linked outer membrane protein n=1 Tax=Saccharicrinis sp. FJH62 TaxID=3344657 RepID=UPI0035D4836D
MKRILLFTILTFAFTSFFAQTKMVKGKVSDPAGELLIGVNIMEEGTDNGTVSAFDGTFSISLTSPEAVLVFSYLGYEKQEIPVQAGSELDVVLKPRVSNLDELVIIGYGSIKKRDLTGSMSVIKLDDAQTPEALSVGNVIQGMASGVKVSSNGNLGAEPNIQIRGIGNFGNSQPLYVIDGIISTGGLRDLNVNDIESVQILKDASTAAIYGNRAANGVVIITTKKGVKGKPRINVSTTFSMDKLPALHLMDTAEFFKYNDMAYENAGLEPQNHYDNSTDWEKEVLRTGFSKDINLTVSGANDYLNYLVSANYYNIKGTSMGTNLDRYNIRANTEYNKGRFTVGEKIAVTKTEVIPSSSGNPITDVMRMTPDIAVKDSTHPGGWGYGDEDRARTFGTNSLAVQDLNRIKNWNTRIRGIVYGQVKLFDWLKYRANFAYETSLDGSQHRRQEGNWTLNLPFEPNSLYDFTGRYQSYLYENFLTFDKEINGHKINVVLGSSRQDQSYKLEQNTVKNFAEWNQDITAIADPTGSDTINVKLRAEWFLLSYFTRLNYDYKGKYLLSASLRRDASSQFAKEYRAGYFPSIALGWIISSEDFFNVPFISNLKLKANYGELGNSAIVNWGAVSGLYDYIPTLTTYPLYVFGNDVIHEGATERELVNRDLRWETKQIANFGTDMGFIKNKLQISADYFISTTKDLLLEYPILLATGNDGGNPWVNAGTLQNRGVEIEANWSDQIRAFKYSVSINATKLKNEVLDLPYFDQSITTGLTKTTIGDPLAMFHLIKTDGIFQTEEEVLAHTTDIYDEVTGEFIETVVIQPDAQPGDLRYIDYNQDGIISQAGDRQYAGSPWPKLEAGININASYKGFDFTALGFGAFGQTVWNGTKALIESFADNSNYATGVNPWTPDNTNTTMPRIIYGDDRNTLGYTDYWLEDGSYFKIQQLSLGYSLNGKVLEKYIRSARIGISAQNLYTFTKYNGLDAEFNNGNKLEFGVDGIAYPNPTSYLLSINITF